MNEALVDATDDLIEGIETDQGLSTAIVVSVSVVAVISVALTIYLCIYGCKTSKDGYQRAYDLEEPEAGDSVQSFD